MEQFSGVFYEWKVFVWQDVWEQDLMECDENVAVCLISSFCHEGALFCISFYGKQLIAWLFGVMSLVVLGACAVLTFFTSAKLKSIFITPGSSFKEPLSQ